MCQARRMGLFPEAREERRGCDVGMGKNEPGITQAQTRIDM